MSARKEQELSFDDKVQHLTSRKAWEDFFQKTPCVKSSKFYRCLPSALQIMQVDVLFPYFTFYTIGYLWGIGCGALMMAHKARIYRKFQPMYTVRFNSIIFNMSFLS